MFKHIVFLSLIISIFFLACDKNKTPEVELNFISLTATDTVVKVGKYTKITAIAEGDKISYSWEAKDSHNHSYPNFKGKGSQVEWYGCHAYDFIIYCTVTDKYKNSETKSIKISAIY